MKKRLHKFFAMFLCCVFALLCVGCAGNDSDFSQNLDEQLENGNITEDEYLQKRLEAMSVPLYGSKVLYRPDDYNWEENVGIGNTNYYEQYAWYLLQALETQYAIAYDRSFIYANTGLTKPSGAAETGFYDSIRYQMQSYDIVTLQKIELDENNEPITENTQSAEYLQITANLNKRWNWSLGGQINFTITDGDEQTTVDNKAYLYDDSYFTFEPDEDGDFDGLKFGSEYYPIAPDFSAKNTLTNFNRNKNLNDFYNFLDLLYYSLDDYLNSYSRAYLGTDYLLPRTDLLKQNYSDYVKAMEYAIYCINLDLMPNSIGVTYDTNGLPIVTVDRYPAQGTVGQDDYKSSATVALEDVQKLFKQIGTYVGVNERQQTRLVDWVCDNVIGRDANGNFISDDTFTITSTQRTLKQYVKMKDSGVDEDGDGENEMIEVLCDKNGNEVREFLPETSTETTQTVATVNRDYYNTVSKIIEICTSQVNIGNSNTEGGDPTEDDPHINDKFPASNIVDFFGNDFFYTSDHKFPNEPDKFPIEKIDDPTKLQPGPLEYQSVAIMMSREFSFSNLWLAFKYDAGMDGDTIYDPNNSITLNVHLHLYTHDDNNYRNIGIISEKQFYDTFQVEIKDGPFSYGETTATMMLNGLCEIRDEGYGPGGYAPRCKPFNTNIGNGVLQSIDYNNLMQFFLTKQKAGVPLPLNGNDLRRKYYKLVDGEVDDDKYYSYGVLNPEMFAGADGCDFFEIAFEVVKVKTADPAQVKNYKFYTGLLLMDADNMV